jgi:hypothetical protein
MNERNIILKSREVSIREQDAAKLKHKQQRQMESKWVEQPNYAGASVDMTNALIQVRTSNTTIPVDLSRFHGSYLYNKQG